VPTRLALPALLLLLASLGGCAQVLPCGDAQRDTLHQISTIEALMAGMYDGDTPCRELTAHGDLGLGTFNALDGEMVVVDGRVHQVLADGNVRLATAETLTPFAAVTWFEADRTFRFEDVRSLDDLKARLAAALPSPNLFYAVRIHGAFAHVRTRSVPRQRPPYPILAEVVKNQPEFRFEAIHGDVVGFYCPEFAAKLNVPGFHLHFLDDARSRGGHLLDLAAPVVVVELDETTALSVALPASGAFRHGALRGGEAGELESIER